MGMEGLEQCEPTLREGADQRGQFCGGPDRGIPGDHGGGVSHALFLLGEHRLREGELARHLREGIEILLLPMGEAKVLFEQGVS